MKEKIQARIQELTQALESTAANYNSIHGRLDELKNVYNQLCENSPESVEPVSDVPDGQPQS